MWGLTLRRLLGAVVCLGLAAVLAGSARPAERPFRVMQLNLCNSGIASCYTGRSVAEAATVIQAHKPDVVALNEVCDADVEVLGKALKQVHPRGKVTWAFAAAHDRRTNADYRCRNGQRFGVGLLVLLPGPDHEYRLFSGIYPDQDPIDAEERTWLCLRASAFAACTTHLAYTSASLAMAQCRHLFASAIPGMLLNNGYVPTVFGGDLNLGRGGDFDVATCVPPAYTRVDDGTVQHVVATPDLELRTIELIQLRETDHAALRVDFIRLQA